ncbi:S8 family serine peptidase [Mesobacillus subterraneus]|uniref:S8 family peptidase n=1 Tax=Mesobacillus subterraneus TaxID=285983 RepID=UPI00203DC141|nr:S8 family serine peptidase [Mesobacillus subterraneus]MCM3683463.1 S8 family serine peptidase [Mesobacillus subterraneus]
MKESIWLSIFGDITPVPPITAGNDAVSGAHYPSSYENVISVSSTTSNDDLSYLSNYGSDIDIAAPGSSILSTVPNGGYAWKSGTSMASPVVAGVAALILSNEPYISNNDLANRLLETADDLEVIHIPPLIIQRFNMHIRTGC